MQANSNIKPSSLFEIEVWGDMSTIIFYPEYPVFVAKLDEEGDVQYEYEMHRLEVPSREGLVDAVETNYESWLNMAKVKENEPKLETDKEKMLRLESENKMLENKLAQQDSILEEVLFGIIPSMLEV